MVSSPRDEDWIRELFGGLESSGRKVGPSAYSSPGRVSTEKADAAQDSESLLERDFLHLLEFDWRVERFATQAVSLPRVTPTGRVVPYTPDVLVKYSDRALKENPFLRHTLFEVKPAGVVREEWKQLKPKWVAAICWCKQFDLRFHVVTEARIRVPRLKNIQFLRRFRAVCIGGSDPVAASNKKLLLESLEELGTASPRQVLDHLTENSLRKAELLPWLWQLICEGSIQTDFAIPLTMTSSLWVHEQGLSRAEPNRTT